MIRRLSEQVIGQIAAGEVIERPASVIKELVENAIDGGAGRIEVTLEEGGKRLVRVVDDGDGIPFDELVLAVERHATSKLARPDDLFHIGTLGFRGEALASIGSVSHLTIRSRPTDQEHGGEIECRDAKVHGPSVCGVPSGTTVEVRNLFYNVPARRKFLKSDSAEVGQIVDWIVRLALAHPEIGFWVTHNGRKLLQLPPARSFRERLAAHYGADVGDNLVAVSAEGDGIRVGGFIGTPSIARRNRRLEMLFLNGRFIKNVSLSHAIRQGFSGFLVDGRFAVAFLQLSVDPSRVDVNVHPVKIEVRFEDQNKVFRAIHHAVRQALEASDIAPRIQLRPGNDPQQRPPRPAPVPDWFSAPRSSSGSYAAPTAGNASSGAMPQSQPEQTNPAPASHAPSAPPQASASGWVPDRPAPSGELDEPAEFGSVRGTGRYCQMHRRYILMEDEDGLVILDQHAFHERITFEELKRSFRQGEVAVQRLLVPELVTLDRSEVTALLESAPALRRLGLEITEFGEDTIAIQAVPVALGRFDPAGLIQDLAGKLENQSGDTLADDLLDDVLATMACRSSVMFGDSLQPAEIRALIDRARNVPHAQTCPHSRPTTLKLTFEELDRFFKRI
ncbi:MAG: DNA mismatch repair endonuclease MutL [Planctomycetota bacterium]